MAHRCRGGGIRPPRERSARAGEKYFAVRIKNQQFVSGHGFTGRGKTRFGSREPTSRAKARPILKDLAARLKSCPSQNLFVPFPKPIRGRVFPQPVKEARVFSRFSSDALIQSFSSCATTGPFWSLRNRHLLGLRNRHHGKRFDAFARLSIDTPRQLCPNPPKRAQILLYGVNGYNNRGLQVLEDVHIWTRARCGCA